MTIQANRERKCLRCGRPYLVLLFFLTALSVPPSLAESKFSIRDDKTTCKVPFELIDNRVFVEAWFDGQGPFHIILDTGADGFNLSDVAAQKLGLRVEDAGQGVGAGEKTVHTGRTHVARVQIGDLQFEDVEVQVLPGGDSGNVFGNKPMDGVVGLAVFERLVVRHDYIHRTLTFTVPDRFNYRGNGMIVPFERPRLIPIVDGELDGVRGRFGIDTGARSSLLIFRPFAEQHKLKEKYDATLEGITGWGIGGPVRSLLARAKELKISNVVVRDLVIRISTQRAGLTTSQEEAGVIGPDVLAQFNLTVDYSRNRIIFEKNGSYGRRDSYDRAGMWMGQDGERFTVVDVIAGGPADQAGIRPGDAILAIDGVSAATLILPDVREHIRRAAVGKKMGLLIESGGQRKALTITLRDLV